MYASFAAWVFWFQFMFQTIEVHMSRSPFAVGWVTPQPSH